MRISAISVGIAVAFAAGAAQAQTQCQVIGNQGICADANGNRSTTQRIGNQRVTYSDGSSSSSRQIGNRRVTTGQQQPYLSQIAPVQPVQHLGQVPQAPAIQGQPRQKMSLLQVIGHLEDAINTGMGGRTYDQIQQANQQRLDAGAFDNIAKQQDIAQTEVAIQQKANQLVGGFARGLLSLRKAGSNLDIAGPALAQQMGIPQQQAAAILAQAKVDPNFLGVLAENAAANNSNGESAATQQIGNQRVTNFSNGTSATTRQIGNQTITS